RSIAACLRTVFHPKLVLGFDAMLVIGPEHARIFQEAGWDRARLLARLSELLMIPGAELARDADGIAEGLPLPPAAREQRLPKFRPGGLLIVHAGGPAGLFSAVIGGWVSGGTGSQPVLWEIGA
ncbi:MAG: thioredoxin, partial [Myxococcota bacterium]